MRFCAPPRWETMFPMRRGPAPPPLGLREGGAGWGGTTCWRLGGWRGRAAETVRIVVWVAACAGPKAHESVTLIVACGAALGSVDRQEMVVRPQPVPMGVVIAEKTTLQHLVG